MYISFNDSIKSLALSRQNNRRDKLKKQSIKVCFKVGNIKEKHNRKEPKKELLNNQNLMEDLNNLLILLHQDNNNREWHNKNKLSNRGLSKVSLYLNKKDLKKCLDKNLRHKEILSLSNSQLLKWQSKVILDKVQQ